MAGQFIILEGGEGAGKTTLAAALGNALRERGQSVTNTREPGGTPWGEKIRKLLIEKDADIEEEMQPVTQLLGHYMARFEHLTTLIIPALERGEIVISDRFEVSSYAYQVYTQQNELRELFLDLHRHVAKLLAPYKTTYLFCDVDPEIGLTRFEENGRTKNLFDAKPLAFHQKVREGVRDAEHIVRPDFGWEVIDASKTKEEMLEEALQKLGF